MFVYYVNNDTMIFSKGNLTNNSAAKRLQQNHLKKLIARLETWKISIHPTKTQTIMFSHSFNTIHVHSNHTAKPATQMDAFSKIVGSTNRPTSKILQARKPSG